MALVDDDDDLPSLSEIFSKPLSAKKVKLDNETEREKEKEKEREKEKENLEQVSTQKTEETFVQVNNDSSADLKINTAVFVFDNYHCKYFPAIITGINDSDSVFDIKYYDGRVETLGRKYIFSPNDVKFYSVKPVPLKDVMGSKNVLIRKYDKKNILKVIDDHRDELLKIIKGEIECERDITFRSSIQGRSSMNNENSPGPFTHEEYQFILEYFSDVFIPSILKGDDRKILEKRFEKTGTSLDHLLRQYGYLVFAPELAVRQILKIDPSVKSLEEANIKLLNDPTAYDQQTGNFINYLYSKLEMYTYARRERVKQKKVDSESED